MSKHCLRLLALLLAAFPGTSFAAGAQNCATCTKDVAVTKAEIQCVLDRVGKQLSSALDPVVVATSGCGGKMRDGTRLEPVRQSRKAAPGKGGQPIGPYLLTKADAQCLVRKLKLADPKAKEVRIDLRTCE